MQAEKISEKYESVYGSVNLDKTKSLSEIQKEIISFLLPLSKDYADIENWYIDKVIPGEKNDTRKIVRIYRGNSLVAVGIAKKEISENKICTIRVLPEYSGQGIGTEIFKELLAWIGSSHPLITVSQSKASLFDKIFKRFGFRLTSVRRGLYSENSVEYFYNEPRILATWTSTTDAN